MSSPSQVREALAENNFLSALGSTKGALVQVNLKANTDLHTAEDFKRLVIREEHGTLVRLGDVADVVLGAESYDEEVRFSQQRAVFMGIWVLPNANSIDVIARARVEMEAIQRELPSGLQGGIAYDGTRYINAAIKEVKMTLAETLLIVVVVIFLFLGSWRTVLVPIVAIPISLIGAVFLMQIFGFTINLLTLLAVVLSVGLVVDDAIVMVENIERHIREGLAPIKAALVGARELVGPIIAMTITLAAVYTPIGFQGGLTGALFREFAFTLAGAVLISGVVALTLSPVMAAKLLKPGGAEHGFSAKVNRVFERVRDFYVRQLNRTLQRRGLVYTVWGAVSALAVLMFVGQRHGRVCGARAHGRSGNHLRHHPVAGATRPSTRRFGTPMKRARSSTASRKRNFSFQITYADFRLRRDGPETVGQAREDRFRAGARGPTKALGHSRHPDVSGHAGRIARRERFPGRDRDALDRGAGAHARVRAPAPDEGDAERHVRLSADHRHQDRQAGNRSGVRPRKGRRRSGSICRRSARICPRMFGGNYVNRFNMAGRSYKVIPQVQRIDRLTPDQLADVYVSGPERANSFR